MNILNYGQIHTTKKSKIITSIKKKKLLHYLSIQRYLVYAVVNSKKLR